MKRSVVRIDRLFPVVGLIPSGAPHHHDCHEAVLLLRGDYRVLLQPDDERRLLPGQALFIPAGVGHTPRYPDQDGSTESYCLGWKGPVINGPATIVTDRSNILLNLINLLWQLRTDASAFATRYRGHLLLCLEDEIARLSRQTSAPRGIAAVKAHLDAWFTQPLSMANLCAMFHCGRSSLFADFKAAYGISPLAHVRLLRATRAHALLTATDQDLHEIAKQVGLGGIGQLTRLCTQVYGVGARALRRTRS